MHIGDFAAIDDAGYCQIVGRIKDMVIRGGENIYPREIEEYPLTHPGITKVSRSGSALPFVAHYREGWQYAF